MTTLSEKQLQLLSSSVFVVSMSGSRRKRFIVNTLKENFQRYARNARAHTGTGHEEKQKVKKSECYSNNNDDYHILFT